MNIDEHIVSRTMVERSKIYMLKYQTDVPFYKAPYCLSVAMVAVTFLFFRTQCHRVMHSELTIAVVTYMPVVTTRSWLVVGFKIDFIEKKHIFEHYKIKYSIRPPNPFISFKIHSIAIKVVLTNEVKE